ncbi:MAG: hypothetical protein M1828_002880 [Chrysothrix sp. TS-e1954]|nr:MAG: hypothetical protein M1828_002880 [Chrysothrix sp. TS-e1954]
MRRGSTNQFPSHKHPRVWFITAATSPIGLAVTRQLIDHGDSVIAGVQPHGTEIDDGRDEEYQAFLDDLRRRNDALLGSIEELGQTHRTRSAVLDQFEANYFGPVNIIKNVLPHFRSRKAGHIVLFTAITGMVGTPGIGTYCASQWAIEGYCDSLAYEIAPFNIKTSIVQSNIEVAVLTNKITSVPSMREYTPEENPAPFGKAGIAALIDKVDNAIGGRDPDTASVSAQLRDPRVVSLYPPLRGHFTDNLIAETVHAILAVGGHDNPPARHIVGFEGILSVKDKLKAVSEELEEFVDVSNAVDYPSIA